jgi:AraC-like DNA-binding protein
MPELRLAQMNREWEAMLDSRFKWEAREGVDAARIVPVRYPPRAVRRSIEYINANFADAIRLRDIASAVGMSMFHLSRTFRASTGLTLHRYLTGARVERVKVLLLESDQNLAVIADSAGFSDQSHMNKTFKRFTGTTPRLFRRARRSPHSALR